MQFTDALELFNVLVNIWLTPSLSDIKLNLRHKINILPIKAHLCSCVCTGEAVTSVLLYFHVINAVI